MLNIKALVEQRNDLLDKLEYQLDVAKRENRNFNELELSEIQQTKNKINELDTQLELSDSEHRKEGKEMPNVITNEQRMLIEKEERLFIDALLGEKRGLSAGSNGVIIPVSVSNRVVQKVKELSPLLTKATIYNVKGDLEVPKYQWDSITCAYVTELTPVTASGGDFTGVKLGSVIAGALTIISNSLINRASDLDVVEIIIQQLARSIADFMEKELLTSVGGAGKVQGSLATGVTTQVLGATTLVITPDELIDVQMGIKSVYQENAMWIMSPTTWKQIRKLKDSQNRYLIGNMENGDGFTLLGKPVHLSENVPNVGANALCIYYGDMSCMSVKFAQEVQIKVLQEKYADQYATGVIGFVEIDAIVTDTQGLAVYKGK